MSLTVVFDLDGTLIDTAPDLAATLNRVLEREGVGPVPYAAARTMIGSGARRMIERGLTAEGRSFTTVMIDRMLEEFIDHYSESHLKLFAYDAGQLELLLRGTVLRHNLDDILATRDTLLDGVVFTPQQVDEVTEFMRALTDPRAHRLGIVTPERVPSGLAVDDSRRFAIMKPGSR